MPPAPPPIDATLKPSPGTGRTAARAFDIAATIFFWITVVAVLIHLLLLLHPLTQPGAPDTALWTEFTVFWAAAKLALAGQPLAAFDSQTLFAVSELHAVGSNLYIWLYPASFQVALMPLGALSFPLAFSAFIAVSAIAYALAMRSPASVLPGLWRLMLASPTVVLACVFLGQTSTLWTAGLVAGLWAMRGGNAAAAGLAFALLTMKPQLGLLIPVALIAARQWAVIGWATGFTLLITGAATAVTGIEYWALFLDAVGEMNGRVADGSVKNHLMSTFYGFERALGLEHGVAIVPQFVLTAGLIVIIGWVWSRRDLGNDLKCATLCAAIPLATHYALYYEMTLQLAAAMFLIRDGFGQRMAEKAWLIVIWAGPAPVFLDFDRLSMAVYTPPILLVTLAICLVRVRRDLSAVGSDSPAASPCPARS